MSTFVVDASVVLHLLRVGAELPSGHELLAPAPLRSQVLEALYRSVRTGGLSEEVGLDRLACLARFASWKIRYLGDKVLRRKAWAVGRRLGWDSTGDAELIALAHLRADAFVTLDARLAAAASELVPTVGIEALR